MSTINIMIANYFNHVRTLDEKDFETFKSFSEKYNSGVSFQPIGSQILKTTRVVFDREQILAISNYQTFTATEKVVHIITPPYDVIVLSTNIDTVKNFENTFIEDFTFNVPDSEHGKKFQKILHKFQNNSNVIFSFSLQRDKIFNNEPSLILTNNGICGNGLCTFKDGSKFLQFVMTYTDPTTVDWIEFSEMFNKEFGVYIPITPKFCTIEKSLRVLNDSDLTLFILAYVAIEHGLKIVKVDQTHMKVNQTNLQKLSRLIDVEFIVI